MSRFPGQYLDKIKSLPAYALVLTRYHLKKIFRNTGGFQKIRLEHEALMEKLIHDNHKAEPVAPLKSAPVMVIIPVYRGVEETRRCLDSLIRSENKCLYEVIIVNDCSPEPEIGSLLTEYARRHPQLKMIENETNQGFVKSVNEGMKRAGNADIILLNNDTEVANGWLDRMIAQAYSEEKIGTVTPFSNNATICSYPDLDGWPELPSGESVRSIDRAFAEANPGMAVEIPTAVGFCMFIRRSCIEDVGYFDEEAFGKGYGEENDFCCRAIKKGWKNILAADIFVYHKGEVSFGSASAEAKARAYDQVLKLHPGYERAVSGHIKANPAYPLRIRATAARFRKSGQPVLLLITHALGGGTERHVLELARTISSRGARVLILRPAVVYDGNYVELESHAPSDRLKVRLSSRDLTTLTTILRNFGINKMHIHHTIGFHFSIREMVRLVGVSYDMTIHDYYSICPRINMIRPGKGFCGKPSVDDCKVCLSERPAMNWVDMDYWQAEFRSLLGLAQQVFCPSHDCRNRISEYYPNAPLQVVYHEKLQLPNPLKFTLSGITRRFAVLGVLSDHKGFHLVRKMLGIIDKKRLPLEIVLIGFPDKPLKSPSFVQTGPYKDDDLLSLIEMYQPDGILFPARWPETYSYTLSAAMLCGRPVIVPDTGAFPERVKNLKNGFIFPTNLSPAELTTYLLEIPLFTEHDGMQKLSGERGPSECKTPSAGQDRIPAVELSEYYASNENYPLAFQHDKIRQE